MKDVTDFKQLRGFGLTVGGIFLAIGSWPALFGDGTLRMWALGVGGALALLGTLAPRSLVKVYRMWMAVGHVLGWINTRIILGIFFYGLLTPMGLMMRLLGKDLMRLKPAPDAETYRLYRGSRRSSHFRHQF